MSSSKETSVVHGLSTAEVESIGKESIAIKSKSYCPYSNFQVGCALLLSDGSIITGINIENASYPVGVCAERCALGTAIAAGHGHGSFKAIGVATGMDEFCSPCGMCRQFIREFCALDTPIFMFNKSGKYEVKTVEELLPMSFGPEALGKQREAAS